MVIVIFYKIKIGNSLFARKVVKGEILPSLKYPRTISIVVVWSVLFSKQYLFKDYRNDLIWLRLFLVSTFISYKARSKTKSTLCVSSCYVTYFLKSNGVRIETETRFSGNQYTWRLNHSLLYNYCFFVNIHLQRTSSTL